MYFIYCIILCLKLYIEIFFYAGFSTGQKRLESERKRIEADAELKEEVKHLKSMLEQQTIQMAKQRRHFEEQQASQMAEQRAHYDNMMMLMLSCITSQSAQSSSDH